SLFLLILKQIELDSGEFHLPSELVIAQVFQEITNQHLSAMDYTLSGDEALYTTLERLKDDHTKLDADEISELHQTMDQLDGYAAQSKAAKLLTGLGFTQTQFELPVSDFSGGWQMRLNLARALMCRSDLLLLDEPTNHLDLEAIFWLEDYLASYTGTLLLISHDRDFLNNSVNQIVNLSRQRAMLFNGNYASYEAQRREQLSLQQAGYEKQQKEIKHIQHFINRFKAKATKAKQAQSRIKALAKLEIIAPAHIDSAFQFSFTPPEHTPHTLIKIDDVTLGYQNNKVLANINHKFFITDRIGILGANGEGKSTFIKFIAGKLKALGGECEHHKQLKMAYFAQHQLEQLDANDHALGHMSKLNPLASEQKMRDHLGCFNFSNDKIEQKISTLSGGEKARLVLAALVYSKPNLLLLDEPTNHLDIDMRDALSIALQSYEGAMLLVSHDRHLINTVCDSFLLVKDKKVRVFDGSLDDYRTLLQTEPAAKHLKIQKNKNTVSRQDQRRLDAERRKKLRPLYSKLKKQEGLMEKLAIEKQAVENQLTDNSLYDANNKIQLKSLLAKQTKISKDISLAENTYFILLEEIETLEK
ncbi:MAG TPA: ATP-binding cassette domain-containing protein, partial [Gammaproteobacteria bacterium]|nr:ATP-binding cassette domain-containing protein [Gammaproteobacteria bacterium]